MAHVTDDLRDGFSPDPGQDFDIRIALGQAASGAADVGEVLAAVGGLRTGDHDAWYAAWNGLGDQLAAQAAASAARGHAISAGSASLRAATAYGVAVGALAALDSSDELLPAFRRHRAAWDAFVDAGEHDVERVAVPFGEVPLPGYLFHPRGGADRPPLLVGVNGSDGPISSMWSNCAFGALRRGYAVLLFDGPGQQSQLFEHDIPFRPDWETVLGAVLDAVLARPDVDPARVAVYGVSQGGFWVPRALTREHRFAAAVADPGVVDVASSWTAQLPGPLRAMLDAGKTEQFDRDMAIGMRFEHETARTWAFRAHPYGTTGYAETIAAVRGYALDAEAAARITTPLLITSPEHEQFWPGQAEQLAGWVAGSELVPFTRAEGADLHCEPMARSLVDERVFDWLDERLAPAGTAAG
jgi:dienelactone hydrolase